MAVNKVPEMLQEARVYWDGEDNMIGIANVDLPELASSTTSITGVGLSGEVDAPVRGHFGSLELTLNWRTPHVTGLRMAGGNPVSLQIYGSIQNFDHGANDYVEDQIIVSLRGRAKAYAPGTFEAMNTSDSSNTIEVHYIKIEVNGQAIVEIDKYGYKTVINGIDLMAKTRRNIGMN
ncbi:MAG: phage tail protein [Selenomonas ruminantium]|uniref:Phage tail protein n=1 Tax=Selenomonas ruminantium TaxID=971 RepID=A0A927WL81_SELRU|nr:phage tail protein [Selenomonas ruminantium]